MPSLDGAVVLVTGGNGGIGTHFVHDALARGAFKVYATARSPRAWDDERIVPLTLDVTDRASIDAAVAAAADVTVLVNNAGAIPPSASLLDVTEADIRARMHRRGRRAVDDLGGRSGSSPISSGAPPW